MSSEERSSPPDLFLTTPTAPDQDRYVPLSPSGRLWVEPRGIRWYLPYLIVICGTGITALPFSGTGAVRIAELVAHFAGIGMVIGGGAEIAKRHLGGRYLPWVVAVVVGLLLLRLADGVLGGWNPPAYPTRP